MITPARFSPRPWQVPMLDHVFNTPRCALWAGMGLGKTPVVLTYLDYLYTMGESKPTLIIGPLRVARKVWHEECAKWDHLSGLSVIPVMGPEKQRLERLAIDAPVYTVNYENLVWLIDHFGSRWPFETVVADEADYLKGNRMSFRTSKKADGTKGLEFVSGQGTRRAGALATVAHTYVKRFIELTGTPAPNGLVDLWGQIWYLDRGERLGRTFTSFKERWFKTGYDGFSIAPLPHAEAEIHDKIKDICLTIEGADWFALEEPIVNNMLVDLPPAAMKHYREMEEDMFVQIGDRTSEVFNAAAKTNKCLQLANGAVYVDPTAEDDAQPNAREWRRVHDEKIEALRSIVHETNGVPLMVCYEFRSDLARLTAAFPKGRVLKTTKDEDEFKAGLVPLLFLHPKSGGHGIDGFQHACNNIVFFGHNWNLGTRLQVIERIGPVRQMQSGYKRPVYVHNILANGTIDLLVLERHATKKEVQDILLEACKRSGVV